MTSSVSGRLAELRHYLDDTWASSLDVARRLAEDSTEEVDRRAG